MTYEDYLFNCQVQGDIWNQDHRPYTPVEWIQKGYPENGGVKILNYGYNRDKAKIWFEEEVKELYSIHTDKSYTLEYAGITYDELSSEAEDYDDILTFPDGKVKKVINYSYDPSGGPFMSVGTFTLQGKKLMRVFKPQGYNQLLFKFI